MQTLTIKSVISQTEQMNGFYLIKIKLAESMTANDLLGQTFRLSIHDSGDLCLFSANRAVTDTLDFLSTSKLSLNSETSSELLLETASQAPALAIPESNKPCVIIAEATYMANAFYLAKQRASLSNPTVVFLAAEKFPFMVKPARFWSAEMPHEAIGASTLLEDWGIMNRLASTEMIPGCYHGELAQLLHEWQDQLADICEWQKTLLVSEPSHYQ